MNIRNRTYTNYDYYDYIVLVPFVRSPIQNPRNIPFPFMKSTISLAANLKLLPRRTTILEFVTLVTV